MKNLMIAGLMLGLSATPSLALDDELEAINRTAFEAVDKNGDGMASRREVELFRVDVMLSQDYDDDGIVTRREHMAWDMGWRHLAEQRGIADRYWKAREEVFAVWDKNEDGELNEAEQQLSQANDFFLAADRGTEPLDYETFKTGLRIIAAMNSAFQVDGEVVLINVFEVPAGAIDKTIGMWKKSRDFLQKQPGYISTALHRSVGPDATFQLVNIARWQSVESFQAATASMRADAAIEPVEGLRFTPGLYQIILTD